MFDSLKRVKKGQLIAIALLIVILLISLLIISGWIDTPFVHLISRLFKKPVQNRWIVNFHYIGYILLCLASLASVTLVSFIYPSFPQFLRWLKHKIYGLNNQVQVWLLTLLRPTEHNDLKNQITTPKIKMVDGWIALGFLIFSLLFFLSRLQGNYPTVILGGDGGNIASFAAAWDHPTLFTGDELLGNLENIRIYSTVHIPLIRALHRLTGDYSLAYLLLLAPHVFLHLLGFYILGRIILTIPSPISMKQRAI